MNLRRNGTVALTLALIVGGAGCKRRAESVAEGPASTPAVDVSADRALARSSWIVELARDPAPLVALAQGSAGWGRLFEGDPAGALAAFESSLSKAMPDDPVRVGAARAAIELAEAHLALAELVASVLPEYVKVVESRPEAAREPELAAWLQFVRGRQAQAVGGDPANHWKTIDPASSAFAWAQAAAGEGDAALVALFAGRPEGADSEPPAGGTLASTRRMQLASLAAAGRLDEVRRLLPKIDAKEVDIIVGEGERAVGLRDPLTARSLARAYAALAADVLKDAGGWARVHRARAELLAGRPADAATTLEGLLKAPPERATLAELVLTGALGVEELKAKALALRVRALVEGGGEAAARDLVAQMPIDTVAQRVWRTWAATLVGEKVDAEAFPEDRTVLTRALADEVAALGASAPGATDVAALGLVDRYADRVQLGFAEALVRGGREALGVKMREEAEDKANAFSPSPRNRLPALAAAARDNVGLGRPRVALKYLSRLQDRLPEVAGPADMLRDLLTVRAMDQGGSAATGQ